MNKKMKKRIILKPQKLKSNKKISKRFLVCTLLVCLSLNYSLISSIIIPSFSAKEDTNKINNEEPKINNDILKEAKIIVNLKENLTVSFFSEHKVSDFIESINGKIIDDFSVDTTKLGLQEVSFKYLNEENIIIPYSFNINVIDDTPPVIWLNSSKTITTDYKGNLLEDIVCADNLDDNPKCKIIGKYTTNKVGEYNLTFEAEDKFGNKTTKKFTLKVKEPSKKNSSSSSKTTKQNFGDIVKKYKKDNTKIGIDVSSWQGDIDYKAVKKAGVEFVFIRVGSKKGITGEYFVDKKFKQNIEGFNKVGIPVGIYFYSYANSNESAINDAKWVLNQIKGYKIDLPVVYDWESWSFYNEFNQSFYSLSQSAKSYLDTIENSGYKGMLYSSKKYLETVWYDIGYDVWLAHYTDQTTYKGNYSYWQLCSNGRVDGIKGNVDINIYYE